MIDMHCYMHTYRDHMHAYLVHGNMMAGGEQGAVLMHRRASTTQCALCPLGHFCNISYQSLTPGHEGGQPIACESGFQTSEYPSGWDPIRLDVSSYLDCTHLFGNHATSADVEDKNKILSFDVNAILCK